MSNRIYPDERRFWKTPQHSLLSIFLRSVPSKPELQNSSRMHYSCPEPGSCLHITGCGNCDAR
ncbi:hypothetical protein JZ751_023530 [Albula glossodonta]|uniref:Uncharacterized protein n=1 Tax=Albula glossodonta TaxID=121402 RepID=A0A8T2NQ01_9TELE|nr:hypothetical protein JZ751_023530 [Albula glossodonta]